MAFTQSQPSFQNFRTTYGTYTSASGSTGGQINTGLTIVFGFMSDNGSQSATTNQVVINSPSNGYVTLTTVSNETGDWFAYGI